MIKIFLLGRPGTGKSTIAQILATIAKENGWNTYHFYDYRYLHNLFLQEENDNLSEEERSFRRKGPGACRGFDVRKGKFEVLDKALKQMAGEVWIEEQNHANENSLLLIEFARKEYVRALDIFGSEILKGAHLLYVKVGLDDCIERVQKRADIHRLRSDYDHYISEEIMRGYYREDDWSSEKFSMYLNTLRTIDVTDDELGNSGTEGELKSEVGKMFRKLVGPQLVAVT